MTNGLMRAFPAPQLALFESPADKEYATNRHPRPYPFFQLPVFLCLPGSIEQYDYD